MESTGVCGRTTYRSHQAVGSLTGASRLAFLLISSQRLATLAAYCWFSISARTAGERRCGAATAQSRTCVSSRHRSFIPGLRFVLGKGFPPVVPAEDAGIDIGVMYACPQNLGGRQTGRDEPGDRLSAA